MFVYDFTEACARQRISEEIFIKIPLDGDLWARKFWERADDTIRPEVAQTLTHLRLFESQQIKFIIIQCHVHLPKVISNCGWLSILLRVRARCTTLTITERLSRYFIVQNPKIKYFSFLSLIDRQWLKIHKSASKIFSKWSGGAASRKVWRLSQHKKDFWRFLSLIAEN